MEKVNAGNHKVAIHMQNISKSFGSVLANNNVNLTVYRGEVHAILGENGAGKSTLMNMLSGIYRPDGGDIFVDEKQVHLHSPKDSFKMKIGMIHQHFKLVDALSAKENIVIGQKTGFFSDKKALNKQIESICEKYGLYIDPDKKVYNMSVGEKQTLEIVKVLYRGAEILILDEPTAVLTPQEIKKLFDIINNMKNQGCAVVIITHKLNEVMEISDRVTVLRRGETIGTVETEKIDIAELIEMMVGKKIDLAIEKPVVTDVKALLEIESLTVENSHGGEALKGVSFDVRKGEILGIAGVTGSGQKELCEAIAGLLPVKTGKIKLEDENIAGKSPAEIIKSGVALSFVPEDRLGMGLVGSMGMVYNLMLKNYRNTPGIILKKEKAITKSKELIDKLEIKTPGIYTPVKKLSGGNIQKVLLGREIDANPKLIITAYPVRGLDINASYKVYDLLNKQKKEGVGVVFVGEDLDVILELCDRVVVLCNGEITGVVDTENVSKEELGLLMTGTVMEYEEVGFNELA